MSLVFCEKILTRSRFSWFYCPVDRMNIYTAVEYTLTLRLVKKLYGYFWHFCKHSCVYEGFIATKQIRIFMLNYVKLRGTKWQRIRVSLMFNIESHVKCLDKCRIVSYIFRRLIIISPERLTLLDIRDIRFAKQTSPGELPRKAKNVVPIVPSCWR